MSLRLKKEKWQPDAYAPTLTLEQTRAAFDDLTTTDYPHVERAIHDPPIPGQKYALFSFCQAEPNKYGVLAFAKVRGVFDTEEEAATTARKIIRKTDSVNKIHTVRVGTPFPICEAIMGKLDKVILDEELAKTEDEMVKRMCEKDAKAKQDLDTRVQRLRDDVDETKAKDPVELYIVKRNKMATTAALYDDYLEKIELFKQIMIKTNTEIKDLETPEILECYQRVYEEKIKEVGLDKGQACAKIKSYFEVLPAFDFLNNKC